MSTSIFGLIMVCASTTKLFSQLVGTRVEMCKLNLAILYVRTFQNENLVPNFVRFRVAMPRLADSKVIRQCRNSILRDELKFKRHLLRQPIKHMALLDQELKAGVPQYGLCPFDVYFD
jgi:hypothetical protein